MACWVASSASPEAAFWREKLRAAICSTREVERKETAIVESRAVISRTRMRALPEAEDGSRKVETGNKEDKLRMDANRKRSRVGFPDFMERRGLVGVKGDEATHSDGALGDEALDIRITRC